MKTYRRLTQTEQVDIVRMFSEQLVPASKLAGQYGVTRQGVYKVLRRYGVDLAAAAKVTITCIACGSEFKATRSRVRKAKSLFCCRECYFAYLSAGGPSTLWRQGGRIARAVVSKHFDLKPGHIVHHIDGNQYHNAPRNLIVFRNQGDHIRHHRGFETYPLWVGDKALAASLGLV